MPQQIPLQFQPRRQDRFETFVAGRNEALVNLLANLPAENTQSIFIHGDSGSGKTHLLNAMCHRAQQQGVSAIYLPLARLDDTVASQLHGLENTGVVCIDDLDNACSRVIWEEALFHLFNRVIEKQGTMLIAAREAPLKQAMTAATDIPDANDTQCLGTPFSRSPGGKFESDSGNVL